MTRTFAAPGTFTATATVTDDDGATGTASQPVTVADAAPVARFTSTCTGRTCSFDASTSTDADGTVASYAWSFGDGGTGTGVGPSRTYAANGTYSVQLTVTDNRGLDRHGDPAGHGQRAGHDGSFVAKASRAGGTAASHALAVPTQAATGDQLLMYVSTNAAGTTSVTAPAGWTGCSTPPRPAAATPCSPRSPPPGTRGPTSP